MQFNRPVKNIINIIDQRYRIKCCYRLKAGWRNSKAFFVLFSPSHCRIVYPYHSEYYLFMHIIILSSNNTCSFLRQCEKDMQQNKKYVQTKKKELDHRYKGGYFDKTYKNKRDVIIWNHNECMCECKCQWIQFRYRYSDINVKCISSWFIYMIVLRS